MSRQLLIMPRAGQDIDDIWEYIARDSLDAANRVKNELYQEMRGLLAYPGKGHTREDVRDKSLRFWKVYSYLIVYGHDDQTLTVVRVIHGARNLSHWLGSN